MIVIGHKTIGEDRKWIFIMDMMEGTEEFMHVFLCTEYGLSIVSAHNDVIKGVWDELSFSCHCLKPLLPIA